MLIFFAKNKENTICINKCQTSRSTNKKCQIKSYKTNQHDGRHKYTYCHVNTYKYANECQGVVVSGIRDPDKAAKLNKVLSKKTADGIRTTVKIPIENRWMCRGLMGPAPPLKLRPLRADRAINIYIYISTHVDILVYMRVFEKP